jgi:hypothetical protein
MFPSQSDSRANPRRASTPDEDFPARTATAGQVIAALGKNGFQVSKHAEHDTHIWIALHCGAVISAYATGTVLVQGRISGPDAENAARLLHQVLPGKVVWKARVLE